MVRLKPPAEKSWGGFLIGDVRKDLNCAKKSLQKILKKVFYASNILKMLCFLGSLIANT